jgi:hypothetical protein
MYRYGHDDKIRYFMLLCNLFLQIITNERLVDSRKTICLGQTIHSNWVKAGFACCRGWQGVNPYYCGWVSRSNGLTTTIK